MADTTTTPVAPAVTVEQLVAAVAAALLPLAGPIGVAVAAVVPALTQLLDAFKNHGSQDFTVDELVAIVQTGNVHLAQLQADRAEQKRQEDAAKPTGGKTMLLDEDDGQPA